MRIVVAGGTGFIGTGLVERLLARGDDVVVLSRHPHRVRKGRGVAWAPPTTGNWQDEVADAAVVVNLAGENIGDARWSDDRKAALTNSRLEATRALTTAIRASGRSDLALVNASAIGYYGLRGDEVLDESATKGTGFLSDLCQKWEDAANEASSDARVAILRFGIVLDDRGGALKKMLPPFRMGVGGPLGSGEQWMSWIDREDTISALVWAADRADARGAFNVTAPVPMRNREFTRELGRALHRPAFLPAPAPAIRLLLGEMADELLLGGQRVIPARLDRAGFAFKHRELSSSLAAILSG